MTQKLDPVALTEELIRCPSVTPREGGALDYLQDQLTKLGFRCWRHVFSDSATPDVDNLFARLGTGEPHLCFAGHSDVVPPGDTRLWKHPPFAAVKADDALYGRGAADMKGAIACFIAAVSQIAAADFADRGSISLLITGDEEGPSINGTEKMLPWMQANGHVPNLCMVGEPTNPQQIGEMLKIGRRGYVNGEVVIHGKSGHTAYAQKAKNPIPGMARMISALSGLMLDHGNEFFEASTLEFTTVDVGNTADNVIPETVRAQFNIRFNNLHTRASLEEKLQTLIAATLAESGLSFTFTMDRGAEAFITTPGCEIGLFEKVVRDATGLSPARSTSGGTSDARFIRNICPVFEFGLVNGTIHQIDEHVRLADLEKLTTIYANFMQAYFA